MSMATAPTRLLPTRARCFQRVKAGAMMGGSIGLLAGLIFGTFSVIRYGQALFGTPWMAPHD